MTREDAILCLKGIKQYGSDTFTKRSQGDWQDSLDVAIDIMRKYQKIERIINAPIGGTSAKYNAIVNIIKYSEAIEGENDD